MKRILINRLFTIASWCAAIITLVFLFSIIWTLLDKGLRGMNLLVFTESTPSPMETGGLLNAIVGSVMITGIGILIATPIGILIATYLSEYQKGRKLAQVIRFVNDILLSAPSIIIGLFVYAIMVKPLGNYSALAGSVALAIIAIPMIVRTTEDVFSVIPFQLREAAIALGVQRWQVICYVIYRYAFSGMITAVLLALGRIAGETAPLLFTALNNNFFSWNLNEPMSNLPVVIYQFAMSPYESWQNLAWAGSLLITGVILILNLSSRYFSRNQH